MCVNHAAQMDFQDLPKKPRPEERERRLAAFAEALREHADRSEDARQRLKRMDFGLGKSAPAGDFRILSTRERLTLHFSPNFFRLIPRSSYGDGALKCFVLIAYHVGQGSPKALLCADYPAAVYLAALRSPESAERMLRDGINLLLATRTGEIRKVHKRMEELTDSECQQLFTALGGDEPWSGFGADGLGNA